MKTIPSLHMQIKREMPEYVHSLKVLRATSCWENEGYFEIISEGGNSYHPKISQETNT